MAEDTAPANATPPEPIGPAGVAAPDSSWADTAPPAPTSTMTGPPPSMAAPAPAVSQAPAAPSIDPASAAQMHSDGLMGRAAHFLLGTQTKYAVDPSTGKMTQTSVSQSPGQLFRAILSGAILGGAAGSQDTTGSGLKGAAMGGGAVIAHNEQQDQLAQKSAREDFQQGQQVDAAKQQQIMNAASIAHMHVQDLHANMEMDLASREHNDKQNQYNEGVEKTVTDAGGQEAPVLLNGKNINGIEGNGYDVLAARKADPAVFQAPVGMHRIHTQTTDLSGLTLESGKGYVDKDGNPVDLTTRTTHKFFDIPNDTLNEQVHPGADLLNSLTGTNTFKPGSDPSLSRKQLIDLKSMAVDRDVKLAKAAREKEESQIGFFNANTQRMNAGTEARKQAFAEKLNGEDNDSLVKGMISPTPSVDIFSVTGLRTGQREQLIKQAMAADPNFNPVSYKNKIAMVNLASTGEIADAKEQVNTFLGHTSDMSRAVQDLRNHSLALANTPINKLRTMTGNPAVSNFFTLMDVAGTEFQKALAKNGVLTESDKKDGKKIINEDMSPAQLQGQAKTFGHTVLVRLGSMNEKYRNVLGSNVPNILSEDGRQAVRTLGISDVATHYLKDQIPAENAKQLVPGQETNFNTPTGVQTWTSYNGQPVRLK